MKGWQKKRLIWIFKIALALFLIVVLFESNYLDSESLYLSFSTPSRFMSALVLLFFGILAGAIRWWLLLTMTELPITFKSTICIQLISSFFSAYLPGAAGGDVVRGLYVFRHIDGGKGRSSALFSIVVDRVFALFGLLSVAALLSLYVVLTPENGIDASSYIEHILHILVWGACLFLVLVLLAVLFRMLKIVSYFPSKAKAYLYVAKVTMKMYLKRWPELVLCGIISVVASAGVAAGIVIIASIFPFAPKLTISAIAGVFGNVFSAIPITPGGLGVGEMVFAKICTDLAKSIAPYGAIYLNFRMCMLLANIPGAIIYLLWRGKFSSQMAVNMAN